MLSFFLNFFLLDLLDELFFVFIFKAMSFSTWHFRFKKDELVLSNLFRFSHSSFLCKCDLFIKILFKFHSFFFIFLSHFYQFFFKGFLLRIVLVLSWFLLWLLFDFILENFIQIVCIDFPHFMIQKYLSRFSSLPIFHIIPTAFFFLLVLLPLLFFVPLDGIQIEAVIAQ